MLHWTETNKKLIAPKNMERSISITKFQQSSFCS